MFKLSKLKNLSSSKNWLRLMVVLAVALALAAGYFESMYANEHKKYLRLEDMYVRVRSQLGREETQRLIDQSYE